MLLLTFCSVLTQNSVLCFSPQESLKSSGKTQEPPSRLPLSPAFVSVVLPAPAGPEPRSRGMRRPRQRAHLHPSRPRCCGRGADKGERNMIWKQNGAWKWGQRWRRKRKDMRGAEGRGGLLNFWILGLIVYQHPVHPWPSAETRSLFASSLVAPE